MDFRVAIIYTPWMFKFLGIIAWAGCLLVLAYQGLLWLINGVWTSITAFDLLHAVFGLNMLSFMETLPLEMGAKLLYVALTSELTICLWWLGVAFFALALLSGILLKK